MITQYLDGESDLEKKLDHEHQSKPKQAPRYGRFVILLDDENHGKMVDEMDENEYGARLQIRCSTSFKRRLRDLAYEKRRTQSKLVLDILKSFMEAEDEPVPE